MKLPVAVSCGILCCGASAVCAQTLQLPSTHYFSTNSSVLVPDQGQVYLGGINRSSSGTNQFGGLPGNRSRGTEGQASGASVTAFVHDFEAYDQALLAEAARRRKAGGTADPSSQLVGTRSAHSAGLSASASVAEIEQQRRAVRPDPQREAESYFALARRAQDTGKARLARVYYQMAARRATGDLKAQALAEVAAIGETVGSTGKPAPR